VILFIAIGLAAGVLAGLFGIGGGIVIGPALILLAKFQPQTATGTSLGALLLPVGALGAWECVPDFTPVVLSPGHTIDFSYPQPCTPPQFFHANHDNPQQAPGGTPLDTQWYEPHRDLRAHYLSRAVAPPPEKFGDDPCGKPSKVHDLNLGQEFPHGPFGGG